MNEYGVKVEWNWRGENWSALGKTCHSAALSTTYPTWTAVGLNMVLHSEKPATNHVCCVTSFVTLRHKFNVLCVYVSDFKEPYPARTAYQVAKLPLVRDILSFGYSGKVWGLYSDDCEDCCLLWCIVFWCNCAKCQCSSVRLHIVTSQNNAALTVSNYSWSICCNVWKYASQHLHAYM
jgi:hypothetical protein